MSLDATWAPLAEIPSEIPTEPPEGLPSVEDILSHCRANGYLDQRHNVISGVLVNTGVRPVWIKYSHAVRPHEGRMQHHLARLVNDIPNTAVHVPEVYFEFVRGGLRYIAMEYIPGDTVEQRRVANGGKFRTEDIEKVAAAIQQLISLRVPADTPPGPISGGTIWHNFFNDDEAPVVYPSSAHLQDHINRVSDFES